MSPAEPKLDAVRRSAAIGAVAVFVVIAVIALAFGAEFWQALLAGVFLGVIVGGGIGFLVAGQKLPRDPG